MTNFPGFVNRAGAAQQDERGKPETSDKCRIHDPPSTEGHRGRRQSIIRDLDETVVAIARPNHPADGGLGRRRREGLRKGGEGSRDADAGAVAGRGVVDMDARRAERIPKRTPRHPPPLRASARHGLGWSPDAGGGDVQGAGQMKQQGFDAVESLRPPEDGGRLREAELAGKVMARPSSATMARTIRGPKRRQAGRWPLR